MPIVPRRDVFHDGSGDGVQSLPRWILQRGWGGVVHHRLHWHLR